MLEKYKELIDKARSAELETLSAWYSYFHMRDDPFLSQIPSDDMEYFVDRDDIINTLIYNVGVSSRGIPILVLIVGPHGSGKTSVLQHTINILGKLGEESEKYLFNGELLKGEELLQKTDEDDEVQLWVKISKKKLDFLFVDDARPLHIKTIMQHFTNVFLKIFAVSPLDLEDILSVLSVTPGILYLDSFTFEDTVEMLNRRIRRVALNKESNISIFNLFEEDALKTIHMYSMGVPTLILKCASQSLKLLQLAKNPGTLNELRVTREIAAKACKITKCFHSCTEYKNISRTKMTILQQIIKRGMTPTEISSILRRDRTTISRHLGELRKMGLVDLRTRGREAVYEATEAVKIRFEIESIRPLMKGKGWNLAAC